MKFAFVITDENHEILGAAGTLEMAHNFCREYADCNGDVAGDPIEVPIDNVMDLRSGPVWRVRCEPLPDCSGWDYDLFIDRVPFFAEGTVFPVDFGNINLFPTVRRQAD